ncbi:hypothetical protein HW44_11310, partial [Nitrosococcus oceani]
FARSLGGGRRTSLYSFDVVPGLAKLRAQGHTLAAFSNGPEDAVRALLINSGIMAQLQDAAKIFDPWCIEPDLVVKNLIE